MPQAQPHPSRRSRRTTAAALAVLFAGGMTVAGTGQSAVAAEPDDRAEQFSAAAQEFGVPEAVLLGVSYMESRWSDHGGRYSTSGGFGPMHLTDAQYAVADSAKPHYDGEDARGDDRRPLADVPPRQESATLAEAAYATLPAAAELIGADAKTLRTDPLQNIRGGAALLESYYDGSAADQDDPFSWYEAVARYSGSPEAEAGAQFADFVYEVIGSGASADTDDGTVTLAATKGSPDRNLDSAGLAAARPGKTDCPKKLKCEWIPAPYEQYGQDPGEYGNHDLADRPNDLDIDYIVVHDTETSYTNTLKLVQDPTYVSWQYTMRSFDGHVAQHLTPDDVAWQAGNWSINSHSVGIEHEGVAADGSWFTEAMYASSAKLVGYLADRYDIPLDRAHIIGHENVPATDPAHVPTMHWDAGPFWDWEHYFDLLDATPQAGDADSGLVTVAPGWDTNYQEFYGCDSANPAGSCGAQRSASTVFLHSEPSTDSPLLNDPGLDPSGAPATNRINDVGSRVGYGQTYAVAEVAGDWTAVWFLGKKGWIHNPADAPVLIPADGQKVSPLADDTPVYGVVYPEDSAYEGTGVPVQKITPLPYTLDKGQSYSFAGQLPSNYFYAKTFAGPNKVVEGERTYYQVQVGGRVMYVDAADVTLS